MPTETRDRIIETTAELFRRYGYTGTGIKQIVEAANAPFGSIYHFFPGGKEHLGTETIRRSGRMYGELVGGVLAEAADAVSAMDDCFTGAAATLEETDYADACPIATVALEVASTSEPLRQATAAVFTEWIAGASAYFAEAGMDDDEARESAIAMLCLLEGAFVFSRAMRDTEALAVAGRTSAAMVEQRLGGD